MARFRLKGKHYLNVPGTEWEKEETPLGKGTKTMRKRYQVPVYLDPEDPADCNYPGEVIVATKESRTFPKDIIFDGPPTADMEPLDDEAQELFDRYRPIWEGRHPIDSLPSTYGEALMEDMQKEIEAKGGLAPTVEMNQAAAKIANLEQKIAELTDLISKLTAIPKTPDPPVSSTRRV